MGSWRSRVRELACANATASNAMSSNCRLRWPASHATFLWSPSARAKSALHARFLRSLRERQLLGKIGTQLNRAVSPLRQKPQHTTHITHQTHTSHTKHTHHTTDTHHTHHTSHTKHQTHTSHTKHTHTQPIWLSGCISRAGPAVLESVHRCCNDRTCCPDTCCDR